MDREEADRQLSKLTKLFIKRFEERADEFGQEDLEEMAFILAQLISFLLKCNEKGVNPKNVYMMLGMLTSYMSIVREVDE